MPRIEAITAQIRSELPSVSDEDATELARVVQRLVDALQPERVYVFGSRARGDATLDSDVDLLVVVSRSELPPYRRDQLARRAIGPHYLPLDVLVMTHEEFEGRRAVVSSLPATVVREGRTLYAA